MKVAHASTTSTDTARCSDDRDPVIPKIPGPRQPSGLGPRPAPPARPLTARPLSDDLDWGPIPTAPYGPVSINRTQVTTALRDAEQDEPAERMYDRIVLGQPHAWGAF